MTIIRIIAAILFPPLAIFLVHGLHRTFWIGIGLTMLGFVPGMVYALVIVLRGRAAPDRPLPA